MEITRLYALVGTSLIPRTRFIRGKYIFKFLKVCTRFILKNHLIATYPYTRAENSSTGCTNIFHEFCKCSISVRSVVNQTKKNTLQTILFTVINVFFKAETFASRADLSEL